MQSAWEISAGSNPNEGGLERVSASRVSCFHFTSSSIFILFIIGFEIESCRVAQTGLELAILPL
jgi:hypothetical protein